MPTPSHGILRRVVAEDLKVGLICADRDGNRVRIDRFDRTGDRIAFHYLNDELRVQEGIQERPISDFLDEIWYLT